MPDPIPASFQGKSWRLNTPDVTSEILGNEVVAIHLPTGMYYSMEGVAAVIWSRIEHISSFEQMVQQLTSAYDITPAQAETDLTSFLTDLIGEKLIVETPESNAGMTAAAGERQPYVTPRLEKFSDLQELLMIDPIHGVDQRGWPHAKPV